MEDRYKRTSILEANRPSYEKSKEKFAKNNMLRSKLRRQKIFTKNRMKYFRQSVTINNTFHNQNGAKFKNNDEARLVDLISDLKKASDELERFIDRNEHKDTLDMHTNKCAKILSKICYIISSEWSSMNDVDDPSLINSFIENDGITLILPFLRLEYYRKAKIESMCILASVLQTDSGALINLEGSLIDLVNNLSDIGSVDLKYQKQYMLTAEYTWVWLSFLFKKDPLLIPWIKERLPFEYISELVRSKIESLSIISWILINIIISNYPEYIIDFLNIGLVPGKHHTFNIK